MATERVFSPGKVSSFQAIIESVFHGNTVRKVGMKECYELARRQPGVIQMPNSVKNFFTGRRSDHG